MKIMCVCIVHLTSKVIIRGGVSVGAVGEIEKQLQKVKDLPPRIHWKEENKQMIKTCTHSLKFLSLTLISNSKREA